MWIRIYSKGRKCALDPKLKMKKRVDPERRDGENAFSLDES
jgi:hypothetical protein